MFRHLGSDIGKWRALKLRANLAELLLRRLIAGEDYSDELFRNLGPDMLRDEDDMPVIADMHQVVPEDDQPHATFALGPRDEDAPPLRAVVEHDAGPGMAEELAQGLPVDFTPWGGRRPLQLCELLVESPAAFLGGRGHIEKTK